MTVVIFDILRWFLRETKSHDSCCADTKIATGGDIYIKIDYHNQTYIQDKSFVYFSLNVFFY